MKLKISNKILMKITFEQGIIRRDKSPVISLIQARDPLMIVVERLIEQKAIKRTIFHTINNNINININK